MEYSSENEEEFEGILKQAFEVKITSDFNPNSIPKDGTITWKLYVQNLFCSFYRS